MKSERKGWTFSGQLWITKPNRSLNLTNHATNERGIPLKCWLFLSIHRLQAASKKISMKSGRRQLSLPPCKMASLLVPPGQVRPTLLQHYLAKGHSKKRCSTVSSGGVRPSMQVYLPLATVKCRLFSLVLVFKRSTISSHPNILNLIGHLDFHSYPEASSAFTCLK